MNFTKIFVFLFFVITFINSENLSDCISDLNGLNQESEMILSDKEKINFISSIKDKNYEEISKFLTQYSNVDFLMENANTPLFYAIDVGDIRTVKLLIEHSANIYHVNNNLETTLHIAVKKNHLEIARLLLESGVPVSSTDIEKHTSLFYAKEKAYNELIALLTYYKENEVEKKDSFETFIKNF